MSVDPTFQARSAVPSRSRRGRKGGSAPSLRSGAAALVALATFVATPAAAATLTYTLSGVFPMFGADTSTVGTDGQFSSSKTLEELAPSFAASLGVLKSVTIEETLGASTQVSWVPILAPGTSNFVFPPSVGINLQVESEIRAPLNAALGYGAVTAMSSNIFALSDSFQNSFTKTSVFSDAGAMDAFLSTSAPLTIYRTADVLGHFGHVVRASAGAYAAYQTVITYDYDPADTAPAPEPATWALMIAGFGLTGVTLRRRRAVA